MKTEITLEELRSETRVIGETTLVSAFGESRETVGYVRFESVPELGEKINVSKGVCTVIGYDINIVYVSLELSEKHKKEVDFRENIGSVGGYVYCYGSDDIELDGCFLVDDLEKIISAWKEVYGNA